MNTKTIAKIGELLLEEAILDALSGEIYLSNNQIHEKTGIYTSPKPARGPYQHIINGMMDKLESEKKVEQLWQGTTKVWRRLY